MKPSSFIQGILALVAASTCALAISGAASGANACCNNFRLLYFAGDAIRNYDLLSTQPIAGTNVDWGVSLLFYNNATVTKVKNQMASKGYTLVGSTMYGRLSDDGGANYVFDDDGGVKKGSCTGTYTHFRLYAHPSYGYMYNPAMGYFIFGTTHYDSTECLGGASGWSEAAEHDIAVDAYSAFFVSNQEDWANFYNYEGYRVEGCCHVWDQDGRASYVRVP
jgi:hypothetical protein